MQLDTLIFGGALLGVLLLSAPACYIAECITKRLSALLRLSCHRKKVRKIMKDSSNYLLALAASEEAEMITRDTWHDHDKWVDKWGGEIN